MHFCLKLGITYIKLGFSAHDMQIRIAKIGIARAIPKIARAMWNFALEILARAKFWLSPVIEFWLLIFRRLPVFYYYFKKHPAPPPLSSLGL